MTAALLAPAGLLALAALALPLLVHLARRTQERPTVFAALRWLAPRPRPRRRPRLDELALLAVRIALLAILALGLAHPVLRGAVQAGRWVAAVPGVDPQAARAQARGSHAVWLAPGWPDLAGPPPAPAGPFASLLRELDAGLPRDAGLTVLVPSVLEGADAERLRLAHLVQWRVAPGAMPAAAPPAGRADAPLVVLEAPGRGAQTRYLRAAAAAWTFRSNAPRTGVAAAPAASGGDRIAWWRPGPLPADLLRRVAGGAVGLLPSDADVRGLGASTVLWRDASGAPLAEGGPWGLGRWRRFTRPLDPDGTPELLDADFPARVHAWLADPQPEPGRVRAVDYAPRSGARPGTPAETDVRPALALAAAGLFAAERVLATRRRRAPAP